MPNATSEDDKKHGDKLQSLIDRTDKSSSPGKRSEGTDDDAQAARQGDEDDDEHDDEDNDEDNEDADEDIQPDDVDDRGAMGR